MISLVVDLRDPELVPYGPAADGSSYRPVRVTVATSRVVRLTSGGFLWDGAPVERSATTADEVTFSLPATDGAEILAADRSTFVYVVTVEADKTGVGSSSRQAVTFRGLLPTSLGATVQVADLVNAEPLPAPFISVQDVLDAVGDETATQISTPGTAANDAVIAAVGAVTDGATAALVDGASATRGAVITAARVGGKMLNGSKWLIVGDSISIQGTTGVQGQNHTTFLAWRTAGRMREIARVATSGETSAQQLTRVRAQIAAGLAPTMATVMVGTNDLGQSVNIETWKSNVRSITQELRAIGCESVLYTLPPRSPSVAGNNRTPALVNGTWNAWLRAYAREQGFPLVDVWRVVTDPATGEYKTGWYDTSDGVHPNSTAMKAIGDEALRVLSPVLMPMSLPATRTLFDGNHLVDGIFTSSTIPATWIRSNPGAWTAVSTADAPGGYAVRHDSTDPATRPDFKQTITTLVAGQRMAVTAQFRNVTNTDVPPGFGMRLTVVETGGATYSVWCFGQNLPTTQWQEPYLEWVVGAGVTTAIITWQYLKPASTPTNRLVTDLGSIGVYSVPSA